MPPQEVYKIVSSQECDWYPDKCKDRFTWDCPSCGKEQHGNCVIVKRNHEENSGWKCEDCEDAKNFIEFNSSVGNEPTWEDVKSLTEAYQAELFNLRTEEYPAAIEQARNDARREALLEAARAVDAGIANAKQMQKYLGNHVATLTYNVVISCHTWVKNEIEALLEIEAEDQANATRQAQQPEPEVE